MRHLIRAVCAALLLLLCVSNPAAAQNVPLPISEYWQELAALRARLLELAPATDAASRGELEILAAHWEAVTVVQLEDGTLLPLDHTWLVVALRADPPNLTPTIGTLMTLLDARSVSGETPWPSDARAHLAHILSQPEFQTASNSNPLSDWWNAFLERVFNKLDELLPGSVGILVSGPFFSLLMTVVGTIALAFILSRMLQEVFLDFAADSALPNTGEETLPLTGALALKRAQALSSAGDNRAALRYLYLSTLLLLEERGLLHGDRTLTNREYVAQLLHRPQVATVFRDVVDVFERVWYGRQPIDEAAYARYAEQVQSLEKQP